MAFSERLKLIIDTDVKGFTSGLGSIKKSVSEADGFFGKLKAGAGGLADSFHNLGPGAKAGIAAGGIAAVGAAAFSVVTDFADLGIQVGEFSDATGLSAEESSRWVEVAGEMGIASGTLESVLGKMNKTIDPEKFRELGIEIVKAKDGTTDVSATFLNVIDRLHGMTDATEQARAGAAIFGKGWQQVAELVGQGADEMRTKLAAVEDQKVLSDDDVKKAREFRATMDDLKDALEDVSLTLGKDLLPLVKAAVDQFTTMIHVAEKAAGAIGGVGESFTHLIGKGKDVPKMLADVAAQIERLQFATKAGIAAGADIGLGELGEALEKVVIGTGEFEARARGAADAAAAQGKRMEEGARAVELAASANQTYVDTLNAEVEALNAAASALNDQISAAENAADAQLSLNDATESFAESAAETIKVGKEKGKSSAEYKDAVEDERDALISAAKAQVKLSDEQAQALGVTATATEKIDDLNKSLENQAAFASPAARKAAYDYIGQLNQIPPEKLTEIQALIDQGRLDEANALIAEASRTRQVAIEADAKTAQAEADLEALARDRTANIYARTIAIGSTLGVRGYAMGGRVSRGSLAVVGEDGPELVRFGDNATVTPADETRQLLAGGGSAGWPGLAASGPVVNNYNLTVHVDHALTERELSQMLARMRRVGQVA